MECGALVNPTPSGETEDDTAHRAYGRNDHLLSPLARALCVGRTGRSNCRCMRGLRESGRAGEPGILRGRGDAVGRRDRDVSKRVRVANFCRGNIKAGHSRRGRHVATQSGPDRAFPDRRGLCRHLFLSSRRDRTHPRLHMYVVWTPAKQVALCRPIWRIAPVVPETSFVSTREAYVWRRCVRHYVTTLCTRSPKYATPSLSGRAPIEGEGTGMSRMSSWGVRMVLAGALAFAAGVLGCSGPAAPASSGSMAADSGTGSGGPSGKVVLTLKGGAR
jgi:hypothetical protein